MFRCLLNYSFNLIIWIYSCFPTMGNTSKRDAGRSVRKRLPKSGRKTDKKRRGTNKSDAVPKRLRSGIEHVPFADISRRRSKRFVPTIEKKTAKRVVLSDRDKKSDATQKSPPLLKFVSSFDKRRRQAKRNTSVTTQGKKSQRKGGQSPSFSTFAEAFKSEHQQHKKKTGTKSDAVQKSSLLLEFVSPVEERRSSSGPNRAKMFPQVSSDWTHVNDAVLEIPKFNAEPSPSGERRMVTRSAARKIRTGGLFCVPDDDFFMVGAGWQKPSDAKDKKTIGTSDAHPDEPRSAVQPVPADEMPDGVDQPAGLPDPNYRSLEQKLS
ncbi:uncharacterized protein LOC128220003 isoform X3 [Mya arenaria]|uniref:uncharacterized protein LOC128220003 isoform X3 n=1 Tax=Mya arenaria TaxID=6604 RepID=UPI0022E07F2C|nr:uncharacterized protein LOC128220003 isoform X3 [Mya arenaria]